MMKVSRSAYYAWAAASESKKAAHDKELTAVITRTTRKTVRFMVHAA